MAERFPTPRLRLALAAYGGLMTLALPLVLLYLAHRGRKDRDYTRHLGERFGRYPATMEGAVWVHAVSLGEFRSALPLIEALLARGERVVVTLFTPAGRRAAEAAFRAEAAEGRYTAVWVPYEAGWCFRRFFRAFRPTYGLVMEIEIWPRMIAASRAAGVPLLMCNAQYPLKSFARDASRTPLRSELMQGFAGALVKSDTQRERFASVGVENIAVTGELRFAQPLPEAQRRAGEALRGRIGPRPVICIASGVEGEEALYRETLAALKDRARPAPLVLYVPRAPERFGPVADGLAAAGFNTARRSKVLGPDFTGDLPPDLDVLVGDSLGEMTAYIAASDRVLVGGGFTPKGAHNIIEALAQAKPVIVGPETWTIEYPAEEAIAAGVCTRIGPEDLLEALTAHPAADLDARIARFLAAHAGAVEKTLAAIPGLLTRR